MVVCLTEELFIPGSPPRLNVACVVSVRDKEGRFVNLVQLTTVKMPLLLVVKVHGVVNVLLPNLHYLPNTPPNHVAGWEGRYRQSVPFPLKNNHKNINKDKYNKSEKR